MLPKFTLLINNGKFQALISTPFYLYLARFNAMNCMPRAGRALVLGGREFKNQDGFNSITLAMKEERYWFMRDLNVPRN